MVNHIRGNRLLLTLAAIYLAYFIVGFFTPRPYVSSIVGILALGAGVFMFGRYVTTAWKVLWWQERGAYGAHDAVLGAAELALGMIYSGTFRLVWNYFDQPDNWSGTWYSSLGLFMIAKGAYRIALSPTDDLQETRFPKDVITVLFFGFALVVAYVAGATFGR